MNTPKQPTLFPLVEDARPAAEKRAAERYLEPGLFSGDRAPVPRRGSRWRVVHTPDYIEHHRPGCPCQGCQGGNVVVFRKREA
jgi:hypothetical protein